MPSVEKAKVQIRLYRSEDYAQVITLIRDGLCKGSDSAAEVCLKEQWTWRSSFVAYFLGSLGLGLYFVSDQFPALGLSLFAGGVLFMVYVRWKIMDGFHGYMQYSLEHDLKDIGSHYGPGAQKDTDSSPRKELSRFWVAENINGDVVGAIGLDANPLTRIAELRRFSVSSAHRRDGIGKILLQTLVDYAAENIDCLDAVVCSTGQYQAPSMRLYEKWGFKEYKAEIMLSGLTEFVEHHYRLNLVDSISKGE